MKKSILPLFILLITSYSAIAQNSFIANTDNSTIYWKGFKPTGSHNGTIKIKEGNFTFEKGLISGGEFTFDMNSIVDLDMAADSEYNAKLVNHLKSPDFFDSSKYPNAVFKITATEKKGDQTLIKGTLTLKDKTNAIEFLATITSSGNDLNVKSETFKIDRSKWDVKFKSKSFFDNLADNFIYDDMEISFDVKAKK